MKIMAMVPAPISSSPMTDACNAPPPILPPLTPPNSGDPNQANQSEPQPMPGTDVVPHLNFWQKPLVQNLLPLGTSVTVHLGILIVALLIGGAVMQVRKAIVQEQITIPDASFTEGPVGGVPNPGLGGDPNRITAQDQFKDAAIDSTGLAERPSQTLTQSLMGGGAGDKSEQFSVIGLGANNGQGKAADIAKGEDLGTGEGGGAVAAFGVPGGGSGAGPKATFFGTGGNAHCVIYLCDASGTMMDVMAPLKVQLQQSIEKLSPMQSFNVIFFSDEGSVSALNEAHPLLASPENKRKAYDFLSQVAAAGSTDPYKAIKMAFVQKPDLLFVLTDGFDQVASIDDVVNEFARDNPGRKAKVNTLLLRRNQDETFVAPLQKIAHDSGGGVYKALRPEDF
jgi:hypothetical protein